jgi:predicted glycosyltransferase involved in capsule biosynthesis
MSRKLAIIIPYRNRAEHLSIVIPILTHELEKNGIDYQIVVVEQDDDELFNRGALLNAGVKLTWDTADYFVLQDVDMYPANDVNIYHHKNCSGSLVKTCWLEPNARDVDDYFSGSLMFDKHDYLTVNGYSNQYKGWGGEDDDFRIRCKQYLAADKIVRADGIFADIPHDGAHRVIGNPNYGGNVEYLDKVKRGEIDFQTDGLGQIQIDSAKWEVYGENPRVRIVKVRMSF